MEVDFTLCILVLVYLNIHAILGSLDLTILHTNDVHARFEQMSQSGGYCRQADAVKGECFGGIARRMTALRDIRKNKEHVLFLDAGDQFQGTLWFFIHKGSAAAHFMNVLGYDAMALGNHEFDNGVPGLLPFLESVEFPVLACNINATQEPEVAKRIRSSFVFEFGGKKVGVIGYITARTPQLSQPGDNLIFLNAVRSLRQEVTSLKSRGVDILIGLGHSGHVDDMEIAREVDGLDIVIGGHTNTFLYTGEAPSIEVPVGPYPLVVTQPSNRTVLVVQNYAFGKYLGHLDASFDDRGEIVSWRGNPLLLDSSLREAPEVLAELATWGEEVYRMHSKVVGVAGVDINGSKKACRLHECTMGNLLTDALLYRHLATNGDIRPADVAILHSGSIRSSLQPGNITLAELNSIQPFRNTVDIVDIRGKHLREVLEHSVTEYNLIHGNGKFLQIAGMRVLYNITKPDGQRVVGICIRSQREHVTYFRPMDDEHVYRVVVPSFIIKGGDGYTMLKENIVKHELFETLDIDVTLDYITHHNPVHPMLDGRITFTNNNDTEVLWVCGGPDATSAAVRPASLCPALVLVHFSIHVMVLLLQHWSIAT